ncbi:DUF4397 domain-containing protein [Compostibacter hankyongensis]|uniref:DUF4397 domain-containing protein n=1 Tax=Compostibacter hankyongensis TaxID=1007089 RepID=A0ABP8FP94_9BACT
MKKKLLFVGALACCGLFLLTACLKSNDDNPYPNGQAFYFLIQTSPDATPLQVLLNGQDITGGKTLSYPQRTQGYLAVGAGPFQMRLVDVASKDTVIRIDDSLSMGEPATVVLYDSAAALKKMFIRDDYSDFNPQKVLVRFMNLSPDAGPVDVYLDSTLQFSGRTFADNAGNSSYNMYTSINPGKFKLTVTKAGTTDTLASYSNESTGDNQVDLSGSDAAGGFTLFLRGYASHTDSLGLKADYMVHYVSGY